MFLICYLPVTYYWIIYRSTGPNAALKQFRLNAVIPQFITQSSYFFLDNETFFFQTVYYGNLIHCHHSNQIHVLEVQIAQNNIGGKVNTVRERKVAVAGAFHVYLVFLIYYLPLISYWIIYRSTGPNTKLGEIGLNDYANIIIIIHLSILLSLSGQWHIFKQANMEIYFNYMSPWQSS